MTATDDEATYEQENTAFWRLRTRTSRALAVFAAALLVSFVFRTPMKWGDGTLATALYYGAQPTLWIALLVAYRSNARMTERRGFLTGRFRRDPTNRPPG
ncbi:hypothetical protein [Nannocystis radixulma]|uniref:Solute:sodium symporter small subunit n=1 Tax=Nannocystis radixulma TaxID=2995305 RepID=A0ABT5B6I1_9BACT|nr:hypothetical protein [Nannocystis radixulma]MDC0669134.1 hypothetical protein [Nannocystis radixulma]